MPNYYGKTVSNLVKVKDVDSFEKLLRTIPATDDIVITADRDNNRILFHCHGVIGLESEGSNYITTIQSLLEDNEMLIVREIGYDSKLSDINASAYFISNKLSDFIIFDNVVNEHSHKLKQIITFK